MTKRLSLVRRKPTGEPTIYFIEDRTARAIKIGYSVDVQRRLSELQTSSATSLRLLGTMPGSIYDEQRLHRMFERMSGEWFRITVPLLQFIDEHTTTTAAFQTYLQPPPKKKINTEYLHHAFTLIWYAFIQAMLWVLLLYGAYWSLNDILIPYWLGSLLEKYTALRYWILSICVLLLAMILSRNVVKNSREYINNYKAPRSR